MKIAPPLCVLAIAAMLSSNANAFYKCATKDGVVYQDQTCATGTQTEVKIVVPTFGESPKPVQAARATVEAAVKDDSVVAMRVPVVATPPKKD